MGLLLYGSTHSLGGPSHLFSFPSFRLVIHPRMESDDDVMTCFLCSSISCLCAKVRVCGSSSAWFGYFFRAMDMVSLMVVVSFQRAGVRDRVL